MATYKAMLGIYFFRQLLNRTFAVPCALLRITQLRDLRSKALLRVLLHASSSRRRSDICAYANTIAFRVPNKNTTLAVR